jgi:hypothetical protein
MAHNSATNLQIYILNKVTPSYYNGFCITYFIFILTFPVYVLIFKTIFREVIQRHQDWNNRRFFFGKI